MIININKGDDLMLADLYMLQDYFEFPATVIYKDDLVKKYGESEIHKALAHGWLEQGFVCCGGKQKQCICRLSEKGRKQALKDFPQI